MKTIVKIFYLLRLRIYWRIEEYFTFKIEQYEHQTNDYLKNNFPEDWEMIEPYISENENTVTDDESATTGMGQSRTHAAQ
jgi:hypothetical protein